jgi:putative Mg2+ transporter-C (MgtC) family protein
MPPIPLDIHLLGTVALKLTLSWALSLPTGWWREREIHAVGIRTFPIVAMASCGYLLILQGDAGTDSFTASSRVLLGVVAGFGFGGGGAIVRDGMSVHGTATAASIWNTGAIGAAVAMGKYEVAIVLAVLNVITLRGLVPLKKRLDGQPE